MFKREHLDGNGGELCGQRRNDGSELIVNDNVEKRRVDLQSAIVLDEA